MSISEKVKKDLWAKSGNRCAICRNKLFSCIDKENFNIGEECHIVSSQPKGPRHIDNFGCYDSYDNIILLCRNHHKEIDDPANHSIYTVEKLTEIKKEHEKWVDSLLNNNKIQYIEQLQSEINNMKEKRLINDLLRKCKIVLSELFGENDFMITELSNIDFSTHLENDGKIDNAIHLRIVGFDNGKRELLKLLDSAIIRISISNN